MDATAPQLAPRSADRAGRDVLRAPGSSHAAHLVRALEAVDRLPILSESRRDFLELAENAAAGDAALAAAIAADPALAAAALRFANHYGRARAATPRAALARLGRDRAVAIARELASYTISGRADAWIDEVSRFRTHGLAVAGVARRLARELGHRDPEAVATPALFHDIGKLVIARTGCGRSDATLDAATVGQRIASEAAGLGVGHAAIGSLVARRWSLPSSVASAIEHHHSPGAVGIAGLVQLADMLVHYAAGGPVGLRELHDVAQRIGFADGRLAELLDSPVDGVAEPEASPCPLTPRQLEMVRALGAGLHYKEIAADLGLAASTVRSHMHCAYERLGVTDRSQAVLVAVSRGWINPPNVPSRAFAA